MNIELDYQPHSEYRGQTMQVATGIGGYYAKVNIEIDADEADLIETGPHDTLTHALYVLRNRIEETLFARGISQAAAALGRKGGSRTSAAKTAAARANAHKPAAPGKKRGRPRKRRTM